MFEHGSRDLDGAVSPGPRDRSDDGLTFGHIPEHACGRRGTVDIYAVDALDDIVLRDARLRKKPFIADVKDNDKDNDNDGVIDGNDAFPLDSTRSAADTDLDGIADTLDNCPNQSNPSQANYDNDAQGDACDSDDDNDGTPDTHDAYPFGIGDLRFHRPGDRVRQVVLHLRSPLPVARVQARRAGNSFNTSPEA